MNQLVGLERDRVIYEEKGVQIIALAVQSQNWAGKSVEKSEAQFPVLADSEHITAKAYGANLLSQGHVDSDNSEWFKSGGAVFIIAPDGKIVWVYLSEDLNDRVPSSTILENLP